MMEMGKNEVGFYVSCQFGLAFSHTNLMKLIVAYRNFRNSVMVVYDLSKSQFGLNPIKCFRLSQKAVDALNLNDLLKITDNLLQERINAQALDTASFFEEVEIKLNRSHLLQAFLFDHIQPHMPAFNTNTLKLGGSSLHLSQQLYFAGEHSQTFLDECNKMEGQRKQQQKQIKRLNKKITTQVSEKKEVEEADIEALETFKTEEAQHDRMNLVLFSKQVDQLYQSLVEFEDCFPETKETVAAQ
mmetsp:Transcript_21336/g.33016  ORF Transcript_21336/g.33016 Transcript_21336/m.33016 type:complete len:243 (-) Transcript_21336:22-750(-)